MNKIVIAIILINLVSCAGTGVYHDPDSVEVVMDTPPGECKNLGPVFSSSNNAIGGIFVSNESLLDSSMKKLRTKAAELSATHLLIKGHNISTGDNYAYKGKSMNSASMTGIAYQCKRPLS